MRALSLVAGLLACGPKPAPEPGGAGPETAALPTPLDAVAAAAEAAATAPEPPAPSPSAGPPSGSAPEGLTPAREALVGALRTRDSAPSCAAVEALAAAPVPDLLWVVQTVTQPPTVGVRAATCLLRGHALDAVPALERWVVDPGLAGLGWTVLAEIDAVAAQDEALAVRLATRAITGGPDPAGARRRLAAAKTPAVLALLEEGGPEPR